MNTDYSHYPYDTSPFKKRQFTDEEQIALDREAFDSMTSNKEKGDIKAGDKILLTDNYKPFPPYESMVGEVSRAINFKLIKPSAPANFVLGSVITFSWETELFLSVTITITDNKGQSFFVSRPINGKKFLFNTSKLTEGLYYVKFISNDEIVYFGKFTLQ
jgi:hypothetical protein